MWKQGEAGRFNQLPVLICALAWKEEPWDSLILLSAFLIKYRLLIGLPSRTLCDVGCVYRLCEFASLKWYRSCFFMMQNILHYEWHHEHEDREGKILSVCVCVCMKECVSLCLCSLGAASCDVLSRVSCLPSLNQKEQGFFFFFLKNCLCEQEDMPVCAFFVDFEMLHQWLSFSRAITKITNHRPKCLVIHVVTVRG